MLIHGERDWVVPYKRFGSKLLADELKTKDDYKTNPELVVEERQPDAGHCDICLYKMEVNEFGEYEGTERIKLSTVGNKMKEFLKKLPVPKGKNKKDVDV